MSAAPPPGALTRLTRLASVVRADNPGPMTLDGTRSYVLRAPGAPGSPAAAAPAGCVVVDPGPDDAAHRAALVAAGPVELVLVTHRHADHTGGSAALHAATGAPVRGAEPATCHGGEPLADGEVVRAAGLRIEVVRTPGHTADSVCLVLPDDGGPGSRPSVLTGDTVLGRGTTVIAEPDGSLADYLASLDRIEAVATSSGAPAVGLPGHGPVVPDLPATVQEYRTHRRARLEQVRRALERAGLAADDRDALDAVLRDVYGDVDPSVREAARQSVAAQLVHLRSAG